MPDERDDRDRLIRLTVVMEQLTEKVSALTTQLGAVKDISLADLEQRVGILQDRFDRQSALMGKIVAAVGVETMTIIGGLIVWLVTRKP